MKKFRKILMAVFAVAVLIPVGFVMVGCGAVRMPSSFRGTPQTDLTDVSNFLNNAAAATNWTGFSGKVRVTDDCPLGVLTMSGDIFIDSAGDMYFTLGGGGVTMRMLYTDGYTYMSVRFMGMIFNEIFSGLDYDDMMEVEHGLAWKFLDDGADILDGAHAVWFERGNRRSTVSIKLEEWNETTDIIMSFNASGALTKVDAYMEFVLREFEPGYGWVDITTTARMSFSNFTGTAVGKAHRVFNGRNQPGWVTF
jgi:hypothetical protein